MAHHRCHWIMYLSEQHFLLLSKQDLWFFLILFVVGVHMICSLYQTWKVFVLLSTSFSNVFESVAQVEILVIFNTTFVVKRFAQVNAFQKSPIRRKRLRIAPLEVLNRSGFSKTKRMLIFLYLKWTKLNKLHFSKNEILSRFYFTCSIGDKRDIVYVVYYGKSERL